MSLKRIRKSKSENPDRIEVFSHAKMTTRLVNSIIERISYWPPLGDNPAIAFIIILPIVLVTLAVFVFESISAFTLFIAQLVFKLLTTRLGLPTAPGAKLLVLVDFLFSPKTVEQTFKPIIADWRNEYFEALKDKREWKARWISTRYRISFITSMFLSKVFSLMKLWKSASK